MDMSGRRRSLTRAERPNLSPRSGAETPEQIAAPISIGDRWVIAAAVERSGRPVHAVAHGVEDMGADAVDLLQVADPERRDVIGVVVHGDADLGIVVRAAHNVASEAGCEPPLAGVPGPQRVAPA